MPTEHAPSHVSVDRLMHGIEDDVRRARRARALARGASTEYDDASVYESVELLLRRALTAPEREVLLLPDLMAGDNDDWRVAPPLAFSSHRPVVGPLVVFLKRRLILPLTRWLYEYTHRGFTRQQRVNEVLFACIEALAIENAKLRRRLEGPEGQEGALGVTPPRQCEDEGQGGQRST